MIREEEEDNMYVDFSKEKKIKVKEEEISNT
jgi:hypothetical protein